MCLLTGLKHNTKLKLWFFFFATEKTLKNINVKNITNINAIYNSANVINLNLYP